MKKLTRSYLKTALRLEENNDFRMFFTAEVIKSYNSSSTFQVPDEKGFKKLCDIGDNCVITPRALNFLRYLTLTLINETMQHSIGLMNYAGKRTLDYESVHSSLLLLFK